MFVLVRALPKSHHPRASRSHNSYSKHHANNIASKTNHDNTSNQANHHLFALTFNTSPPNSPRFHFLISLPHSSHNLASNSAVRFASSLFFSDEEGERFLKMPPRFSGVLTFFPGRKGWKRGLKRLGLMGDLRGEVVMSAEAWKGESSASGFVKGLLGGVSVS